MTPFNTVLCSPLGQVELFPIHALILAASAGIHDRQYHLLWSTGSQLLNHLTCWVTPNVFGTGFTHHKNNRWRQSHGL